MHLAALGFIFVLLLSGCTEPEPTKQTEPPFDRSQIVTVIAELKQQADTTQADLQHEVQSLNSVGQAFLESPTPESLATLRSQWQRTHLSYARAQFGFLLNDPAFRGLVFRIDAWPIQPGFIDNLPLYPESGIIHDETLVLSAETLIQQHGITDEEEVALGFHSIEYLIFSRPLSDFQLNSEAAGIERRRLFLALALNQLEVDTVSLLEACRDQFNASDYPAAVATLQDFLTSSLQKIRVAFRESNLVTTEDSGHSTFSNTSLETVKAEVTALEAFMLGEVRMGPILEQIDPNAYANLQATLAELRQLAAESEQDEVSRANLPLLLSAITHQLEAFDRMLAHKLPTN